MDSRRDFTSKKVFSGYFSELGEKANSALFSGNQLIEKGNITHEHAEKGTSVIYFSRNQPHKFIAKKTN